MEYLVIGAGGVGGCMGAYLAQAGKNVTLIARGAHLRAMQERGLRMESTARGSFTIPGIQATDMEHYAGTPEVIFVCVKGYSLEEATEFIGRVAGPDTVVIPLLNIYGTGERMQKRLPQLLVTDGCIYVAAQIREPGCIWQNGEIFRVVYGVREASSYSPILERVAQDLRDSGITPVLTDQIRRDALKKFAYVSPAAACGQYYDAMTGDMQRPGEIRDTFTALVREMEVLAEAMGLRFDIDIVETNLAILDALSPQASASMQRDIAQGKKSEIDGLVYEVPRLAKKYQVKLPVYEKIAAALWEKGYR